MFSRAARRQQNNLDHILARRIRTGLTCSTELDRSAIVAMKFRGTRAYKRLVDAKVYLCFLVTSIFSELNCRQEQAIFYICLVSHFYWQDID
jgi:hypothetical protein